MDCQPLVSINNAFDGKYGGMWRARGRIPSKLCGLTFTAYGFDVSSYYVRDKDSERPETAWIMDGVGNGERIGDFGLVGGWCRRFGVRSL